MRFPLYAIAAYLSAFVATIAVPLAAAAAAAGAPKHSAPIYAQFDPITPAPGMQSRTAPPSLDTPSLDTPPPYAPPPYAPRSPQFAPSSQPLTAGPARVYLLRGLLNMLSLGMDDLAVMIRARGMTATVRNHSETGALLRDITARYAAGDRGPVILIGHSLGADAVVTMAQALDRNAIPVALIVLFDGTAAHAVPANVARAINFTRYFTMSSGPGFTGTIENVDKRGDPSIDHLNIDKSPVLQAQVMDEVQRAVAAAAIPAEPSRRAHRSR